MLSFLRCKRERDALEMSPRTPSLELGRRNIRPKSLWELVWAVCSLAISVLTVLDLGDNSCEHSCNKKKIALFFRVTFLGAAIRIIQGGVHWISSAWTFFRQKLVVCRPREKKKEKNRYIKNTSFWLDCCTADITGICSGAFCFLFLETE